MSVIVGASAHGSPGVTTCLEILATVAPNSTVLVEASSAGGSLAARHMLPLTPGMSALSEALRRGESPDILQHSQRLPSGVPVVPLSPSVLVARAQLSLASAELGPYLAATPHDVVVDAGLTLPGSMGETLLGSVDQVLWFVRPLREEVAHLVSRLKDLPLHPARVVTVGSTPYESGEVADVVGLPAISIAYDDKGATAFRHGGDDRKLQRSRLARSIRTFADTVFVTGPDTTRHVDTAADGEIAFPEAVVDVDTGLVGS